MCITVFGIGYYSNVAVDYNSWQFLMFTTNHTGNSASVKLEAWWSFMWVKQHIEHVNTVHVFTEAICTDTELSTFCIFDVY